MRPDADVDPVPGDPVLGDLAPHEVRVRFPPSPTGNLHVGNVRSALFNWAFARHFGGAFVLRIEDTDTGRNVEGGTEGLLDALAWLGLDFDEGPGVGGPHAPYVQTERFDVYRDVTARLLDSGAAYRCFCTREEIEQRQAALPPGSPSGYDGFCRDLGAERTAELAAAGRPSVVRIRVRAGVIGFDDLVRGPVAFDGEHVPDYVVVRANGDPLYTLVNPVDDALMGITHVLRGEDLLPSTPRQVVLYEALAAIGVGSGRVPRFGHLPTVLGEGNRRLSKRDQGAGLAQYRQEGYLPEGLLNYLALLGWAIADDRDVFTMAEMVAAFDIRRVNANPARFDARKCEAINAAHLRLLAPADFAAALTPYLVSAGLVADPATPDQERLVAAAAPLVQERVSTLAEGAELLRFLFTADVDLRTDDAARPGPDAAGVLDAATAALEAVDGWDHPAIEAALRAALVDGLGLKPRLAFGPVRVALTGRKISPPLFESAELLGRDSTLTRLRAARAALEPA